ncbi:hypothetical protein, partial [Lentilactobacillus hilgardii]|uniref:hypothetical protein n=1 Tax=Lentilactobacillus hilgardii TaxID=1588 RepID=UPI0039E823B0
MKKSRIIFVTLLTSLGLAGAIGVQSNNFAGGGGTIRFGITAKADGVQSPVKNVFGNMPQT